MDSKKYRFETLQIHAGLQPDEPTGARGVAAERGRWPVWRPCAKAWRGGL